MSQFLISKEVAELLPQMQVAVVIAKGLDNSVETPKFAAHVQSVAFKTVEGFSSKGYSNAQSHPRTVLYRDTLKNIANVSAKKKKAPRPISPAVDFYNSVSIEHAVTVGAFELDELKARLEPLELRVAKVDEDSFVPLDSPNAEPAKVDAKEILYAQGATVLTRHLAWRHSAQALVTECSKDVMFVSEVLHEGQVGSEPSDLAKAVASSLQRGLKEVFNVRSSVEYLGISL